MDNNKVLLTIDAETKKGQSVVQCEIMTLSKANAIKNFIEHQQHIFEIYVDDLHSDIPHDQIDVKIIEDSNIIKAFELVISSNIPMVMYDLLSDIRQIMKHHDALL